MKQDIGANIRYFRRKANLSIEQLAEQIPVSRPTLSNWENGLRTPDVYKLARIADILNISVDVLIGHIDVSEFTKALMTYACNRNRKINDQETLILLRILQTLSIEELSDIEFILNWSKYKKKGLN
jgi:transcriptional regulator with XRE-family HTH domain